MAEGQVGKQQFVVEEVHVAHTYIYISVDSRLRKTPPKGQESMIRALYNSCK